MTFTELKKIFIKRKLKLESKIKNEHLKRFASVGNFTFIFSNGRIKNSLKQNLDLYKEIFYNYFIKFPHEITVENFDSRSSITALNKIFINGKAGEISEDNVSEGKKHIDNTLVPLGLVSNKKKAGKFEFNLKLPTKNENQISKEIMDFICFSEEEYTLEEKIKKLMSAPYGLFLAIKIRST